MPANRSRTHEWRRSLEQLHERNGSMEIALVRDDEDDNNHHLLWRVRVYGLSDGEIIVEQPSTLGRAIDLHDGASLAVMFAIGQNRWVFRTTILETIEHQLNGHRTVPALRLVMPEHVERCQRRHYYRIETTTLRLPQIEMWPLLDPKSVVVAERACEIEFNNSQGKEDRSGESAGNSPMLKIANEMMPEIGPKFSAELANLGGGGLGVRVSSQEAVTLGRHKIFWLRFILPPGMTTPICATCKLTHSHMDSTQHTYAGLAFDFSFNPGHQEFVVNQICQYTASLQRDQLRRQAKLRGDDHQDQHRRSA